MIIPTANDIKTITDMREDAVGLLNYVKKRKKPTILMHRNSPQAVLISVNEYNKMIDMLEDYIDGELARKLEKEAKRASEKGHYIPLEEVEKQLGLNV